MKTKLYGGLVLFSTLVLISGTALRVSAAEMMNSENEEMTSCEQEIMASDLLEEDKEMLLNDSDFVERHNQLEKEGWVLQEISVEETAMPSSSLNLGSAAGVSVASIFPKSTTYKNSKGKVVSTSYVQPTKSKTYYNNKCYKTAQDIKKYASFASNFISGKWAWVASTLFSIDTSQYASWFNNGYQKLEENATYHVKEAYYKEGSMYWIGYCASKMEIAGTIISYYRDSNSTPHQKSVDYTKNFTSKSYNKSNTALIDLAEKYYNTGWVEEDITYSSVYKLN